MIYRIERYDTAINEWILLYSTANYDYVSKMFNDCISNNPDIWFRISITLASNYNEKR